MKATALRLPSRSDKHIDYENYCRLIEAVQGLLSTQYDSNFFETQQTSAGLVISGRRKEHGKESFDLIWNTEKNVTVKKGLIWCPFQVGAGSPPTVTLFQTADTTLDLPTLGQYLTIYASVDMTIGITAGRGEKAVSAAVVSACDSGAEGTWTVPRDETILYPPVEPSVAQAAFIIPLYATSAQVGSSVSDWDRYILVHDFRYAPRFTFDVQGWQHTGGFIPLPTDTPNVNDVPFITNTTDPITVEWQALP